jgi:hypothetical protein
MDGAELYDVPLDFIDLDGEEDYFEGMIEYRYCKDGIRYATVVMSAPHKFKAVCVQDYLTENLTNQNFTDDNSQER